MSHVSLEELSSSTVQHFGLSRRLKRCTVVPPCGSGLVKCCTVVLQYGLGRLKCCTVVPTCGLGRLQCCTVVPKCGWGRLKCCTFVAKFPDMLCIEGFYMVRSTLRGQPKTTKRQNPARDYQHGQKLLRPDTFLSLLCLCLPQ